MCIGSLSVDVPAYPYRTNKKSASISSFSTDLVTSFDASFPCVTYVASLGKKRWSICMQDSALFKGVFYALLCVGCDSCASLSSPEIESFSSVLSSAVHPFQIRKIVLWAVVCKRCRIRVFLTSERIWTRHNASNVKINKIISNLSKYHEAL